MFDRTTFKLFYQTLKSFRIYRVSKKKKTIIMKGKIKDRLNILIQKDCYDSNNLWKFYIICAFCIEVASVYSTTPFEPFCPRIKVRAKQATL